MGDFLQTKPLTFTALAFAGGSLASITGPAEILTMSAHFAGAPPPIINIVTQDNQPVVGIGGVVVQPTIDIQAVKKTDILLVGSIGFPDQNLESVTQPTLDWIHQWGECDIPIVSICFGAFVLAKANLLHNTKATTHWFYANLFRELFPKTKLHAERHVTCDNNRFCTSGVYEYNDVMMLIVEQMFGQTIRQQCTQFIFGDLERVQQNTLASFVPLRQHNDELIHHLQDWLHAEPGSALSVSELADKVHLSERQMKRRFKAATGQSPIHYIQQVKLSVAKDWLEKSKKTIEEISHDVGYEDTRYFRELFKKMNGLTPLEYRKRYQHL
ncbi:helix-turn-helix domain-containing protein [Vibrio vulnificus]|uniref:GlxA family transcriptional regulator n=1 Tax=Vibrio vulnificus TaxID=672 RepID=UPI000A3A7C13|nr:helix-turn-helix domain-containing protein [Vibrio vulnificus]EGQ7695261.1 helix-turn-helix domain-containing protein [Vibrio vulnificus]EGQ8025399.1 helix-turn-helix domain-containing protein [Vibrio vulnificus]EGQ8078006.1 helix-turn-helix domain-containing protein [Vibrio vulnificus]EGR0072791.1 helix-turn-helix domain-containing protein [Vibrio vulnificus]EHD2251944.1 helix-turn-helix domain-containing protein [Vibrio vulnificus]